MGLFDAEPGKPTLLEHVMEIRGRLVKAALFFFVVSLFCYAFSQELFDYLAAPAQGHLVYTHPVGGMMAYLKISFLCGALFSSPFTLYQVLAFLWPALGPAWRKALGWSLGIGYLLFALGVTFALKVLPMAMHFLLAFDRPGLRAMLNVDQYFSFVFLITFGLGASFQMPLAIYFIARAGLVSAATLAKHWRLAVMACLILGAMICPTPDLVTWLLVCVPLFLLYLISLAVATWAERQRAGAGVPRQASSVEAP
ncbi:MAG TPA: twin-arginine translocase subunit TatC [bacterium]|nr:twin-arginine translocase subunit TatC [bacterium]